MFNIYKNIRVLDLSRILVGPYATMMLSDLGAQVLKIESLEGDETRKWGPPYLGSECDKISSYYLAINRGKKSMALNLKQAEGQELFHELVRHSDVVVENFNIGVAEKLNIDYFTLRNINPKIIYASANGYGYKGPQMNNSGFDQIIQAASGLMSITGDPQGQPTKVGFAVTDILTASQLCIAIQAALFRRQLNGLGCHIQTSLFECAVASLLNVSSNYLNGQFEQTRLGNMHPSIVPYGVYRVGSQFIMIGAAQNNQFDSLCQVIGLTELVENIKFKNNDMRVRHRDELTVLLEDAFQNWDIDKLCDQLNHAKVPCSQIRTIAECLDSSQAAALGLIQSMETQNYGEVRLVRSPLWFDGKKQEGFIEPPLLNGDRDEILKSILNMDQDQIKNLLQKGVISNINNQN